MGKLPCQYFLLGTCRHAKDEDCNYSHDRSICRPGVLEEPCVHFTKRGYCRNGNHCLNRHDRDIRDATQLAQQQRGLASEKKMKPVVEVHAPIAPPVVPSAAPIRQHQQQDKDYEEEDVEITQEQFHLNLANLLDDEMYFYGDLTAAQEELEKKRARQQAQMQVPAYGKLLGAGQTSSGPPAPKAVNNLPVCRYFLLGTCKYGNHCSYSHQVVPYDPASEMEKFEMSASKDLECGICLENIMQTGDGRFGLLEGCDHAFCLKCIRNWRTTEDGTSESKQLVRRCPLCRQPSYFIIPCQRMVRDPARKQAIIQEYKEGMKEIECKFFQRGDGTCPFGISCFYKHVYKDGTEQDPGELRTFKDADGKVKFEKTDTLQSYFDQALKIQR